MALALKLKDDILNSAEFRRWKSLILVYPYSSVRNGSPPTATHCYIYKLNSIAAKSYRCRNSCFHRAFSKTWTATTRRAKSFLGAGTLIYLLHLTTNVVSKQLVPKSMRIQSSRHKLCCVTPVTEIIPLPVAEGMSFPGKKPLLHFYDWFNKVVTLHWCFPNCLLVV